MVDRAVGAAAPAAAAAAAKAGWHGGLLDWACCCLGRSDWGERGGSAENMRPIPSISVGSVRNACMDQKQNRTRARPKFSPSPAENARHSIGPLAERSHIHCPARVAAALTTRRASSSTQSADGGLRRSSLALIPPFDDDPTHAENVQSNAACGPCIEIGRGRASKRPRFSQPRPTGRRRPRLDRSLRGKQYRSSSSSTRSWGGRGGGQVAEGGCGGGGSSIEMARPLLGVG